MPRDTQASPKGGLLCAPLSIPSLSAEVCSHNAAGVINPFGGQLHRANDLQLFVSKYNQRLYGAIKRENGGDFKEVIVEKNRNVGRNKVCSLSYMKAVFRY